jgi:hypothetical protein
LHNRDNHETWDQTKQSSIPVRLQRHFDPLQELERIHWKIDGDISASALDENVMLLATNSDGAQYNYHTPNILKQAGMTIAAKKMSFISHRYQ